MHGDFFHILVSLYYWLKNKIMFGGIIIKESKVSKQENTKQLLFHDFQDINYHNKAMNNWSIKSHEYKNLP